MAKFIRLPKVLEKNGLGKSKTWEMVRNKEFPQPIKLTPGTTVWIEKEVDQWIEDKISEYRGEDDDKKDAESKRSIVKRRVSRKPGGAS